MRLAKTFFVTLALVGPAFLGAAYIGPARAQGDSSESDTAQQGGAVRSMGRVGNGKRSVQSGIEIPDYGGNISAVRRLPLGTTAPRSRSFVRAPRSFQQRVFVSGAFEPSYISAFP